MGTVCNTSSPESLIMPVVRPEADRDNTGSPRTWRALCKSKIWSAISMHCVEIRAATRLTSSVSYRRPRTRSQVHCFFHDPGQRGVPCSSTAFRRRTIRLNHWRLYQWRLQQWRLRRWSLQHPLGEHRSPFSLLLDAVYLSRHKSEQLNAWIEHARELIETTVAAGRRGARAGRRGARIEDNLWTPWSHIDGLDNLFLYSLNNQRNFWNDHLFLYSWIFTYVLRHLPCNDRFLMYLIVHGLGCGIDALSFFSLHQRRHHVQHSTWRRPLGSYSNGHKTTCATRLSKNTYFSGIGNDSSLGE